MWTIWRICSSDEFLHRDRAHLNNPELPHADRHTHLCIHDIHQRLRNHGYQPDDLRLRPTRSSFGRTNQRHRGTATGSPDVTGANCRSTKNFRCYHPCYQPSTPWKVLLYWWLRWYRNDLPIQHAGPYSSRNADICHLRCFLRNCCDAT